LLRAPEQPAVVPEFCSGVHLWRDKWTAPSGPLSAISGPLAGLGFLLWHISDSQGQILALAFRHKSVKPCEVFHRRSEAKDGLQDAVVLSCHQCALSCHQCRATNVVPPMSCHQCALGGRATKVRGEDAANVRFRFRAKMDWWHRARATNVRGENCLSFLGAAEPPTVVPSCGRV